MSEKNEVYERLLNGKFTDEDQTKFAEYLNPCLQCGQKPTVMGYNSILETYRLYCLSCSDEGKQVKTQESNTISDMVDAWNLANPRKVE
jgi:hypothetical protein